MARGMAARVQDKHQPRQPRYRTVVACVYIYIYRQRAELGPDCLNVARIPEGNTEIQITEVVYYCSDIEQGVGRLTGSLVALLFGCSIRSSQRRIRAAFKHDSKFLLRYSSGFILFVFFDVSKSNFLCIRKIIPSKMIYLSDSLCNLCFNEAKIN